MIKLLETGQLAHHKVGTHRRIRFTDLKAFKQRRAQTRSKAMADLTAQAQELGMDH